MAQLNKKCLCCGTKYSYCPSCSRRDSLKPSYFAEFCSETCKDLWLTLTKYGMNRLTKSEAKSIISELDLKPIDTYVACVQRDYAKVMAEEKKTRKVKKPEPIVEVELEQPIVAEPVETPTHHEVVEKENE